MRFTNLTLFSLLVTLSSVANASKPSIVYRYEGASSTPIGVVGLQDAYTDPMDNCGQRIADVTIREVVYDGASDIIEGFRISNPKKDEPRKRFIIDELHNLSMGQMGELSRIVEAGAKVIVIYQICGSGKFHTVRELWLKSAVNNP